MAAIDVTGAVPCTWASEPGEAALPRFTTVPFCSATHEPVPSGVTAIPTTGEVVFTGAGAAR